jgi:phosphoribosyl 1,2-cyclic phosphodiesterase
VLRFRSLGSGSAGNATVVEATSGGTVSRLLVDCGLGIRAMEHRLALAGLMPDQIDAIFITHEHSDHVGSVRQFSRRFQTPVWMSHGTWLGSGEPDLAGHLNIAQDQQAISLGDLYLVPFTVPHDAREPLQLRCSDGNRQLGVLTDLGHATSHVLQNLAGCHALLLECNHDAAALQAGRYPPFLKSRVGGQHGHLSNAQAGEIAKALNHDGLSHVVAAHLSRQNNHPDWACAALATGLGRNASEICVADQFAGSDWFMV